MIGTSEFDLIALLPFLIPDLVAFGKFYGSTAGLGYPPAFYWCFKIALASFSSVFYLLKLSSSTLGILDVL